MMDPDLIRRRLHIVDACFAFGSIAAVLAIIWLMMARLCLGWG
ncbi:hypothetical protein [Ruegeria sp. Alg231-54]|nr:hypothetical protein [Ruegeria sp. Alg231-54]